MKPLNAKLNQELSFIQPRLPGMLETLRGGGNIQGVRVPSDSDGVFIELASDLSTRASYALVAELAQLRPNEIWMVNDYTIRLWWD